MVSKAYYLAERNPLYFSTPHSIPNFLFGSENKDTGNIGKFQKYIPKNVSKK